MAFFLINKAAQSRSVFVVFTVLISVVISSSLSLHNTDAYITSYVSFTPMMSSSLDQPQISKVSSYGISLSPSQNHTQTTNSSAAIYPSGKSWDFQGVGPVSGNREFVARQLVFDLRSLASCSESVIYPKIGFKYVVSQNSIPSGGNGTLAYAAFMPNNTPTSISTIDGSILNASLSKSGNMLDVSNRTTIHPSTLSDGFLRVVLLFKVKDPNMGNLSWLVDNLKLDSMVRGCDGAPGVPTSPSSVSRANNIQYATKVNNDGSTANLMMDIHTPANPISQWRPTIIFMHDGGWSSGSKELFSDEADYYAARGYTAITMNYRLRPGMSSVIPDDIPQMRDAAKDAFDDSKDAVRFIKQNAAQYGVDTNNIIVAGSSAGGSTSLLHSAEDPNEGLFNNEVSTYPRGIVSLSGPMDSVTEALLINREIPTLMISNIGDPGAPYSWSQQTCQTINSVGSNCRHETLNDGQIHFTSFNTPIYQMVDQWLGIELN